MVGYTGSLLALTLACASCTSAGGSNPDANGGGGADAPLSGNVDGAVADAALGDGGPPAVYAPEHCAYFLTGEVDLVGTDADGDGVPNGWDHCPNNPYDSLDSDRDGIGNRSDPDMDGDGLLNVDDPDGDGDGASDADEMTAGTDPGDPSSIPGLPRFELDLGVLNASPGWYRGDLHVHAEPSHDSEEPVGNYVAAAVKAGLDFLWITDHRTFESPFDPGWNQSEVLFIPAIEWGGGGHANIGGIRTNMTANYDDAADVRRSWRLARLQGAVQSLNHYGKDIDHHTRIFDAAPDLLDQLDVMEVWNSLWPFNTETNVASIAYWEQLLSKGYRIGAVGGGDAHSAALTIGMPTTVVWSESLTVPGILDGIRRGRTYVTQSEPFLDGIAFTWDNRAELDFRVDADGDGVYEAMLGDEVAAGAIKLQISVKHAHGPVRLIRNGEEITRFDGHTAGSDILVTYDDTAPAGAWYRVEMLASALPLAAVLLLSSPIYVAD